MGARCARLKVNPVNRAFLNVVVAVLLVAALSTRCVAACLAQSHSKSDSHACCHKGKSSTKPVKSENCEGSSFELQAKAAHIAPATVTDWAALAPLVIQDFAPVIDALTYSPPQFSALHETLLI